MHFALEEISNQLAGIGAPGSFARRSTPPLCCEDTGTQYPFLPQRIATVLTARSNPYARRGSLPGYCELFAQLLKVDGLNGVVVETGFPQPLGIEFVSRHRNQPHSPALFP